jgi:hypothetical protein
MIVTLIQVLFGRLSPEDKAKVLEILKALVKSGAEGAVQGLTKNAAGKK